MSQNFTQCFDIESDLDAPGCKCMAQTMKVDRRNIKQFETAAKEILVIARFNIVIPKDRSKNIHFDYVKVQNGERISRILS